jgi:phosphatidylserine decarboxylase
MRMQSLSFNDRLRRLLWRLVPKAGLSRIMGHLTRIPLWGPARLPLLGLFARSCGIDLSEAEKPLREYSSIHDLFVRRLDSGARPTPSDPLAVCAPADGRVVETGHADQGQVMSAKGDGFSLADLLADREAARALEGGPYHITYLSPGDYHRVHVPVGGHIVGWQHVPGRLFSVNQANLRREAGLFARNERLVILIDGDRSGLCACVMVAAFGVGNITLACDPEVETHRRRFSKGAVRAKRFVSPPRVERGDELGIFHMGSTVISVFTPGRIELYPVCSGQLVRVGQAIGRGRVGQPDLAASVTP